jgi:hypothetical protein
VLPTPQQLAILRSFLNKLDILTGCDDKNFISLNPANLGDEALLDLLFTYGLHYTITLGPDCATGCTIKFRNKLIVFTGSRCENEGKDAKCREEGESSKTILEREDFLTTPRKSDCKSTHQEGGCHQRKVRSSICKQLPNEEIKLRLAEAPPKGTDAQFLMRFRTTKGETAPVFGRRFKK